MSKRAIHESTCNALLLKVSHIGTVTEAIGAVKLAKDAHWGVVVFHRCGETEDAFIADLAIGLATGQIKAGAPCRGERVAKCNQVALLLIRHGVDVDVEDNEGYTILGRASDDARPALIDAAKAMLED